MYAQGKSEKSAACSARSQGRKRKRQVERMRGIEPLPGVTRVGPRPQALDVLITSTATLITGDTAYAEMTLQWQSAPLRQAPDSQLLRSGLT